VCACQGETNLEREKRERDREREINRKNRQIRQTTINSTQTQRKSREGLERHG
jgi:hypothetical protein